MFLLILFIEIKNFVNQGHIDQTWHLKYKKLGIFQIHTVLNFNIHLWILKNNIFILILFLCGSVVEHCVCCAKGCGFDSQGTHVLIKMYNLNAIVSRFG